MQKLRTAATGFTLVEVMVSIAVTAIALGSIFSLLLAAHSLWGLRGRFIGRCAWMAILSAP